MVGEWGPHFKVPGRRSPAFGPMRRLAHVRLLRAALMSKRGVRPDDPGGPAIRSHSIRSVFDKTTAMSFALGLDGPAGRMGNPWSLPDRASADTPRPAGLLRGEGAARESKKPAKLPDLIPAPRSLPFRSRGRQVGAACPAARSPSRPSGATASRPGGPLPRRRRRFPSANRRRAGGPARWAGRRSPSRPARSDWIQLEALLVHRVRLTVQPADRPGSQLEETQPQAAPVCRLCDAPWMRVHSCWKPKTRRAVDAEGFQRSAARHHHAGRPGSCQEAPAAGQPRRPASPLVPPERFVAYC